MLDKNSKNYVAGDHGLVLQFGIILSFVGTITLLDVSIRNSISLINTLSRSVLMKECTMPWCSQRHSWVVSWRIRTTWLKLAEN